MAVTLKQRVEALEQLVASLQQQQQVPNPASRAWLDGLYGKFANDPIFEHAMKLGRKYRQSQRPRFRKNAAKR